jgi:pyridoxal phosphate enzyme (YggS family)
LPNRTQILGLNLERVRARIAAAALAAGRPADAVRLVAVTKSVDAATTAELARLGALDLGENRVDRLDAKHAALASEGLAVRWHMIGRLQRNKARRAAACAYAVHSVDTDRLLAALVRLAGELERPLDVYLELELTAIATRSGFTPDAVRALLDAPFDLGRLSLRGLMTMAAPDERARAGDLASQDCARRTFARLRELAAQLPVERFAERRIELSMGMSDDLEAAVAEGASLVRVGSALFEGLPRDAAEGSAA